MAQGNLKSTKSGAKKAISGNNGKAKKKESKAFTKKGAPLQLPKKHFRDEAIQSREISKAIGKAAEQKTTAKYLQGGGKLGLKDVLAKGKELAKEIRRSQVKKKLTRVEEKLKALKAKSDRE